MYIEGEVGKTSIPQRQTVGTVLLELTNFICKDFQSSTFPAYLDINGIISKYKSLERIPTPCGGNVTSLQWFYSSIFR